MSLERLQTEAIEALVSGAILRAELLDDAGLATARDAWREVLELEVELSRRHPAESVPGGVARAGAVHAAFASGADGWELADRYLAEKELPEERRLAITAVVVEHEERYAAQFPRLAEKYSARDLNSWKNSLAQGPAALFPVAA